MHKIAQEEMRHVSFPDYDVEKMEYFPEQRVLRIFVQGGWFEKEPQKGYELGRGVLFFNDWKSVSITRFYPYIDWGFEDVSYPVEPLKDLCEVIFTDTDATLKGFSKSTWVEWVITDVTMHAEFYGYVEDDD